MFSKFYLNVHEVEVRHVVYNDYCCRMMESKAYTGRKIVWNQRKLVAVSYFVDN